MCAILGIYIQRRKLTLLSFSFDKVNNDILVSICFKDLLSRPRLISFYIITSSILQSTSNLRVLQSNLKTITYLLILSILSQLKNSLFNFIFTRIDKFQPLKIRSFFLFIMGFLLFCSSIFIFLTYSEITLYALAEQRKTLRS